jgi:hypothetical protein
MITKQTRTSDTHVDECSNIYKLIKIAFQLLSVWELLKSKSNNPNKGRQQSIRNKRLTIASMAQRQWMSSDSLYRSRFSGTSPRPNGSNPKSLHRFLPDYTLCACEDEPQRKEPQKKEKAAAAAAECTTDPGAEPSRYEGRGCPGNHWAAMLTRLPLLHPNLLPPDAALLLLPT